MEEIFIGLLIVLAVLAVPLGALILAIIALVRSSGRRDLVRRVEELERQIAGLRREGPAVVEPEVVEEPVGQVSQVAAEPVPAAAPPRPRIQWELLVGQKALGWVAVVVLLFAAAFFLRYAYQNNWIGPLGRVAIGAAGAIALLVWGGIYQRRGWHVVAQLLTAGGVVVSYLATYSAFGFYELLPQQVAGVLLAIIVAESMVLAARYGGYSIALTAVLGGLAIPLLMVSERDQYVALFNFLAVLNLGVVLVTLWRPWPGLGSIALVGTQLLFWSWHAANYHSEKLWWAFGFQAVLFVLYLCRDFFVKRLGPGLAGWEQLALRVFNATLFFLAAFVLLRRDYGDWLGAAALVLAAVYTLHARLVLWRTPQLTGQTLVSLAVAVGFIAIALPLEADAAWIAVGWAAEAAALWWFGLRVRSGMLRLMAAVVAVLAIGRLLLIDVPQYTVDPWLPVLNAFGLPAVAAVGCLLLAVAVARRFLTDLPRAERVLVGLAGLCVILLLWLVLSVDSYGFFRSLADRFPDESARWRWIAQLSLSILWSVFAATVLWFGFRYRLAGLRWLAIGLFGVTVVKVFLVDTSALSEIYRILAFFALAVILGLAALAYNRIRIDTGVQTGEEGDIHASGDA